ncbi:hypothetical protein EVAR_67377_1 [Eumeta japonica]|uniref:Uncharacterized protein n=1 Tax=Eumeta variegata TaxID=151549 RepID=A0A4C2ACI6_EUMVA|nr:hypothetical protein EVAR_67377_1 [Eumeta japonica]
MMIVTDRRLRFSHVQQITRREYFAKGTTDLRFIRRHDVRELRTETSSNHVPAMVKPIAYAMRRRASARGRSAVHRDMHRSCELAECGNGG